MSDDELDFSQYEEAFAQLDKQLEAVGRLMSDKGPILLDESIPLHPAAEKYKLTRRRTVTLGSGAAMAFVGPTGSVGRLSLSHTQDEDETEPLRLEDIVVEIEVNGELIHLSFRAFQTWCERVARLLQEGYDSMSQHRLF